MTWDSTSSWSVSWNRFPDPPERTGFVPSLLEAIAIAAHRAGSPRGAPLGGLDTGTPTAPFPEAPPATRRPGFGPRWTRKRTLRSRSAKCGKGAENLWKRCGFLWKTRSTHSTRTPVVRFSPARHHLPGSSPTIYRPSKRPIINELRDFSTLSTRQINDYNSSLTAPLFPLIRLISTSLKVLVRDVSDPVDIRGSLPDSSAANC